VSRLKDIQFNRVNPPRDQGRQRIHVGNGFYHGLFSETLSEDGRNSKVTELYRVLGNRISSHKKAERGAKRRREKGMDFTTVCLAKL